MKKNRDAAYTVDLLIHCDGVPTKMIMDGSKEQTLGRFKTKCQEVSVHMKQMEPHSPWQNAAEGAIRDLKKASGRKMVRAGAPKLLRANCIEFEAHVIAW